MRTNLHFTPLRSLVAACVLSLPAAGQTDEPKRSESAPIDPGAVEVRFTDGSVLKMKLEEEAIEIMTAAGKKAIPVGEVRRAELALRLSEAEARLIEAAIRGLGSRTFRERERASTDLRRRGLKAYPALLAAWKDGDMETKRRAGLLIDALKAEMPEEAFEIPKADTLHTGEGKLTGKLLQESLRASTTQFGPVKVNLADVIWVSSQRHPKMLALKVPVQPDPGNMTGLQQQIGQVFAFRVTGAQQGSVWGTGTYTSDSRIAVAAVHAGLIKVGETGVVKVRVVPAQGAYVGSAQNGVTTSNYGPWDGSYEFVK